MERKKLIRITTVPMSLHYLLRGQLAFMQANGFEVLAVSADGNERQAILDDGIDHTIIPFTRKITPLQDIRCLFMLIVLFRKVRPDIVHTHTPKAGLLGMLAAWICRVPVRMHTVAGLPVMEAKGVKRWVLIMTERITCYCASRVYPNSLRLLHYMKEQLTISNCQLTIIGKGSSNGIDTTHYSLTDSLREQGKAIRQQYSIPDNALVFGFVGRIVRDKGIGELIEAFRKIREVRADSYLLLVGPLEQDLDPLSKEDLDFLQSGDQVIMAGFKNDVRPWLVAMDVFVFPSYREGFPNVVMQAACLAIPCIVSDINGCNEILQQEETGLLVPPKNSDALFAAMNRLADDEVLRNTFAVKAREFVVEHFDQQYVWGEMLGEYRAGCGFPVTGCQSLVGQ
jgi:glycosyltransferase involved in cell wall biosynthesis